MAGEYSRELSVKVFAGQCRLIELGFRQGGPAGFGLRRQLIDREGKDKGLLARGDRESLQTDRVVLVPGPEAELLVVRGLFSDFVLGGKSEMHIASALNARGVFSDLDRPWTRSTIRQILTNPKYVGSNVYNRRSFKLKMKRLLNPPDMWVLKEGAFPAIVADELFWKARQIIEARHNHLTDDELLVRLRTLLERSGRLSGILIDEADDMPSSSIYATRFGGLHRAYELIEWIGARDSSYIETNQVLRRSHHRLVEHIIQQLRANGAQLEVDKSTHIFTLDRELKVSVVLSPCHETQAGSQRWRIRFDAGLEPDITIAARLAPGNQSVQDYYLFPRIDVLSERLRLSPNNGVCLDLYRFENLDFFYRVSRRVSLKDAA